MKGMQLRKIMKIRSGSVFLGCKNKRRDRIPISQFQFLVFTRFHFTQLYSNEKNEFFGVDHFFCFAGRGFDCTNSPSGASPGTKQHMNFSIVTVVKGKKWEWRRNKIIQSTNYQDVSSLREPIKRWAHENSVDLPEVDYKTAEIVFKRLGLIPLVKKKIIVTINAELYLW